MDAGRRIVVSAAYALTWAVLTLVCAGVVFLNSSRETTLASHDAVIRPDLSGHVVLLTGPVLPDVRVPSGGRPRAGRRRRPSRSTRHGPIG